MKSIKIFIVGVLMITFGMQSCTDNINSSYKDYTDDEYALISKRLNLPEEVFQYSTEFEEDFFLNQLGEENIKSRRVDHQATLGRVLFYDKTLSINETISCASCHKQEIAFADNVAFSEGFEGDVTKRNSLALGNTIGFETAYGSGGGSAFSWDESNQDIASQSKAAILSEIEMGLNMSTLVSRLQKDEVYKILFTKVYGDDNIMEHRVLQAIEEFVNSIVSSDTKFDHETMKHEEGNMFQPFEGFTQEENKGKELYIDNCSTCHSVEHKFTAEATANNGLDLNYEDKGVGGNFPGTSQNGVFKVPFLRNIALTGPYMHDGRFETLEEVVDHYNKGIVNHQNLHEKLMNNGDPKRMNFTDDDTQALIAYLNTLSDKSLMEDVRFSNPFKE